MHPLSEKKKENPMADLIPATPGWYLDTDGNLDPVIAWAHTTNSQGDDILLPLVPDNRGVTPWLVKESFIKEFNCRVVYRPNHDPATDA